MSFLHYSALGALVPALIKKVMPHAGKIFKVAEIDEETKKRVASVRYPWHYGVVYGLWMTVLIVVGLAPLLVVPIWGLVKFPTTWALLWVLLGLANTFGALTLLNGLINATLWRVSSLDFRDYIRLRQIKSGTGYVIEEQIATLIRIGAIYYAVLLPVMALLFVLLRS